VLACNPVVAKGGKGHATITTLLYYLIQVFLILSCLYTIEYIHTVRFLILAIYFPSLHILDMAPLHTQPSVAAFFEEISAEQFAIQVANLAVYKTAVQSVTPTIYTIEQPQFAVKLAVQAIQSE
jgi:hypothetical protein